MPTYVIYEDRNETHKTAGKFPRSTPIAADNMKARATLERAGWRVAEEYEQDDPAVDAGNNLPRIVRELNAFERGDEAALLALEKESAPDDVDDTTEVPVVGFAWADAGLKSEQWDALTGAGYGTEAALNAATDAQLGEVKGVGEASIRNLRKALAKSVE